MDSGDLRLSGWTAGISQFTPGSIRIGVDGQLGSSIYLLGQVIRIGLGGRLESSKLGVGEQRD